MRTLSTAEEGERAFLRHLATRYEAAWKRHATIGPHGGDSATIEQQAKIREEVGSDFTNEHRSRLEVLDFIADPPEKYFAYCQSREGWAHISAITTWMGEKLSAVILWEGEDFTDNFGGKRSNFRFLGINGVEYSGTYYKSSGSYCRFKRMKGKTK